jgi:hypothetical protein
MPLKGFGFVIYLGKYTPFNYISNSFFFQGVKSFPHLAKITIDPVYTHFIFTPGDSAHGLQDIRSTASAKIISTSSV